MIAPPNETGRLQATGGVAQEDELHTTLRRVLILAAAWAAVLFRWCA